MLYLVLAYLIISAICLWAGWLFYQVLPYPLFSSAPSAETAPTPSMPPTAPTPTITPLIPLTLPPPVGLATTAYTRPAILYLLTGLLLLTGIGQWWVLFHRLDAGTLSLTLAGLILITLAYRKQIPRFNTPRVLITGIRRHLPFITCYCSLLLMILVLNAGPSMMDDTESYHIQMIKWVQEYGTVPGIANLHLRFGFNSSWFTTVGLLLPSFMGQGRFLILNGLLSCWFSCYLLQKIFTVFSLKNGPASNTAFAAAIILVIGLLSWPMIRGNATSSNYDFITTCCIIILVIESADPAMPLLWPEWMIWPCYLVTIRITNAPILLIAIFGAISCFRHYKRIPWVFPVAAILLFLPFVTRNILLSGYPLFPLSQFDFFSVDWKADRQQLLEILDYIKYFNRSNSHIELVRYTAFPGWLPIWFKNLFFYDRILVALSVCAWIALFIRWRKWTARYTPFFKTLLLILVLNILVWMYVAPDPRFIYGSLLAGLYACSTAIPGNFSLFSVRLAANVFLVCITAAVFFYSVRKMQINPDYRNALIPRSLPKPAFRTVTVDGIGLRIPGKVLDNWNPRCYDLPLPCLYRIDPRLHARGKNIRDGFRLDKQGERNDPSASEHQQDSLQVDGEYKLD